MPISPIITNAGLAAVLNATDDGLSARITHVALGDNAWTPDNTAVALQSERQRVAVSNGSRIQPNQIHITAVENGSTNYWIRELGFILDDGTLLAVWSDPSQPLAYKAAGVDVLLAFDLVLSALPDDSVTVVGTGGVNLPPATESIVGVLRFSTRNEARTASRNDVAVSPENMRFHSDSRYARTVHRHMWENILAKPSRFPPAGHEHPWTEINEKPATYPPSTHSHSWSETTDKPTTFPPSSHSHSWRQTTGKPTTFPPSAHSHSWNQTTGKPRTFPPSSHSHSWADTSGKPTTFPPSTHSHSWTDTTGKPRSFNPSLHSHRWGEITGKPQSYVPNPHQHSWSETTGKPSTFTPSSHDHDLLYFRKDNFNVSSGEAAITNRYSRQWHLGHDDWDRNYVNIYPPRGYIMAQLRGFTASISRVYFAGNVNREDIMWCRFRKEINNGFIRVIAGNNENRVDTAGVAAYINYMAIWVR